MIDASYHLPYQEFCILEPQPSLNQTNYKMDIGLVLIKNRAYLEPVITSNKLDAEYVLIVI
jgi:hypothetical protein